MLEDDQPFKDFYGTSGHVLVINGIEIKTKNISQAKRIKIKPEILYSGCTEKRKPILINGLNVMLWVRMNG